jgi:hypothetical protein
VALYSLTKFAQIYSQAFPPILQESANRGHAVYSGTTGNMDRKLGQIVARGQSTWLVRIYQGRDPETGTRRYHNQTTHGPFRAVYRFMNVKLRDLSRAPEAAAVDRLSSLHGGDYGSYGRLAKGCPQVAQVGNVPGNRDVWRTR